MNGYGIEGLAPLEEINHLLDEGPEIIGLAVPGMPIGQPNQESGGVRRSPAEKPGKLRYCDFCHNKKYDKLTVY
jgi:hypothetical protein